MSVDVARIEDVAGRVRQRVPKAVTRGEMEAGLYGYGFLGRWALPQLRQRGVKVAVCYDRRAASGLTGDVPMRSPDALDRDRPGFLFIAARHAVRPVSAELDARGIAHASYDAWYVAQDIDAFMRVRERLHDDRSRAVLNAVMMAMLTGDAAHCAAVCEPDQYFCLPQFRAADREVFIDAGAYVGDSAERFIWANNGVFKKIHAFEPGARPFAALQARMHRLGVEWALNERAIATVNAGLGDAATRMAATQDVASMTSAALGGGEGPAVEVMTLDGYLGGAPITLLKADVEGMELALLAGARSTIVEHRPKLAICVYHYPADIPSISAYLAALVPEYRFALRHHSPRLMETVLYAWIEEGN